MSAFVKNSGVKDVRGSRLHSDFMSCSASSDASKKREIESIKDRLDNKLCVCHWWINNL